MKFGESKTPGNTSVGKQKKFDAWCLCGQEAGNLWLGHTGNASQLFLKYQSGPSKPVVKVFSNQSELPILTLTIDRDQMCGQSFSKNLCLAEGGFTTCVPKTNPCDAL